VGEVLGISVSTLGTCQERHVHRKRCTTLHTGVWSTTVGNPTEQHLASPNGALGLYSGRFPVLLFHKPSSTMGMVDLGYSFSLAGGAPHEGMVD
jgi:hypothetical protein